MPDVTKMETDKEVLYVITSEEKQRHDIESYKKECAEQSKKQDLKYVVKKLLLTKPEAKDPEYPKVIVRCNREIGQWTVVDVATNASVQKEALVLINAVFTRERIKRGYGCGAYSEYLGFAAGQMIAEGVPVSVPKDRVRHLRFDEDDGHFYCTQTGRLLEVADYLILKAGCHSEYIEPPEPK